MKKQLICAVAVLLCQGAAFGCEPGSLEFEDAFFKYCDDARTRAQEASALVPAATQLTSGNQEASRSTQGEKRPVTPAEEAPAPEASTTLVRRP